MELAEQIHKTLKEYERLCKSYLGESEKAEERRFNRRESLEPILFALLDDPKAGEAIAWLRLADRLDSVDMYLLTVYYEDD